LCASLAPYKSRRVYIFARWGVWIVIFLVSVCRSVRNSCHHPRQNYLDYCWWPRCCKLINVAAFQHDTMCSLIDPRRERKSACSLPLITLIAHYFRSTADFALTKTSAALSELRIKNIKTGWIKLKLKFCVLGASFTNSWKAEIVSDHTRSGEFNSLRGRTFFVYKMTLLNYL